MYKSIEKFILRNKIRPGQVSRCQGDTYNLLSLKDRTSRCSLVFRSSSEADGSTTSTGMLDARFLSSTTMQTILPIMSCICRPRYTRFLGDKSKDSSSESSDSDLYVKKEEKRKTLEQILSVCCC